MDRLIWTPARVHKKLGEVVSLLNEKWEADGVFFQPTVEKEDDVPILRVLLGPGDPYTAERLGSFAFFSTARGMEWYEKQFGATNFCPHEGQVFVTYFCDIKMAECEAVRLSLYDDNSAWASSITGCLEDLIAGLDEENHESED